MAAVTLCPNCGCRLHVLESSIGSQVTCPGCANSFQVQSVLETTEGGLPPASGGPVPQPDSPEEPGPPARREEEPASSRSRGFVSAATEGLTRAMRGQDSEPRQDDSPGDAQLSEDSYREVTSESWGSRLASSLLGSLVGVVLILASFAFLFWNEGRAIQRTRSLEEGARDVVPVSADHVNPATEGKLVHLTGDARTKETLADAEFGIAVNAVRLRRVVEVYQWKEVKETHKKKRAGGREETETIYSYNKGWSGKLEDSSKFRHPEGHENPRRKPFDDQTWQAQQVTIGAFTLSPGLVEQMDKEESLPVDASAPGDAAGNRSAAVKVHEGLFYSSADPRQPAIGDARIEHKVVRPAAVSVVARQAGSKLEARATAAGDTIELLHLGTHGPEAMFQTAHARNTFLTWLLRTAGATAMAAAIFLIFRPLVVVADVLPVLGDLLSMGLWLFASVLGLALALATIGVAWLFYRPVVGVPALVGAVGGLALLFVVGRRWRARATSRAQTRSFSGSVRN